MAHTDENEVIGRSHVSENVQEIRKRSEQLRMGSWPMSYTHDELRRARYIAARVVDQFGDRFLPLFKVLDAEMQKCETVRERIKFVLQEGRRQPGQQS